MGKIFDALEKVHKPIEHKKASLKAHKKYGRGKPEKGNVVPFSNLWNAEPVNNGLASNLIAFHSPHSVEAELFKVLRTNLLFSSIGKSPKSIMVTSAIPGDGKSFVSANLAITIAQGVEEHVLLIDSDIRRPSIDHYFGINPAEGLSEYLSSGSDVSKHFVKTPVEKLTILPAGKPPENPVELLTTKKMKALIEEVGHRYEDRYIIIDSAPPSLASETAVIANYVDGIIIVMRSGKTPRSAVSDVIEQLGKDKILGIVLNYSDQSLNKYNGYGKSYYKPKSE